MKNVTRMSSVFMLIALLFFINVATFATGAESLTQVQQAIINKGATWQAGETFLSKLSPEQRKLHFGAFLEPPIDAAQRKIELPAVENLPSHFDWRDNNGNWVTPVRDQGQCGSCVFFSEVGQTEAWWKIHYNNLDSMPNLSEQFILSCGNVGSCNGANPGDILGFIRDNGVPFESCFFYRANDAVPCSEACDNWQDHTITIPGWGYITLDEANVDIIKRAVIRHPVSAAYTVYEDFMFYTGGVYEHVWGDVDAGHAILIVGWDDVQECWICKNSWGRLWGENGYFRIKWGDSGMGQYMPFIWDEMTEGPALSVSTEPLRFDLTYGDSLSHPLTLVNTSSAKLEYSSADRGSTTRFHTDEFNAYDGLSWWCSDPEIGGYLDHWLEYLETPIMDLTGTTTPSLTWMGFWSIEDPASALRPYDGWDGCNVWISTDGGQNFSVISPVNPPYDCQDLWSFGDPDEGWNMGTGIAGWAGQSGGWIPVEFDLSDYKTNNVVLRFGFASDLGFCTLDDSSVTGLFIDDILVSDADNIIFEDHGDQDNTMIKRSLSDPSQAEWITLENGGGLIPPFDSTIVNVVINTRKIVPGNYFGDIIFSSNDISNPTVTIPVNVDLARPEHDLGISSVWLPGQSVPLFSLSSLNAKIKNYGHYEETDVDVLCNIHDGNVLLQSDTVRIASIKPNESQDVAFKSFFALQTGELDVDVSLAKVNPGDYNNFNNLTHSKTQVTNLVDGFETDTGYWGLEGGWGRTTATAAHTDSTSAHVNDGITPYENNMNAIMTFKQGFDLSQADEVTLKFWSRFNIQKDHDFCYIEARGDENGWTKLDSLTGIKPAWTQFSYDLTALLADGVSRVWVRFRFVSDESVTGFGIFIDDVEIYHQLSTSAVSADAGNVRPETWNLSQNYPNPFNMNTQFQYTMGDAGQGTLTIYNIQGQAVRTFRLAQQAAGSYTIDWDGRSDSGLTVGSGIYFYHLNVDGQFDATRKMILLK
ncbi:T9SS type A sorting domain-containing protein [candidate division KSB1 bacterium]|nr:T9SS type A sorting domain-containing protein [candidate division KSB1 bacterium]